VTAPAVRLTLALHATALAIALVVAATPGAAAGARELLALNPDPSPGDAGEALAIWAHNLLVLVPLLLAPTVLRWLPMVRPMVLAYAGWQTVVGTVTVGMALGAYGPALHGSLGHVPFEWSALAVAVAHSRPPLRIAPAVFVVVALAPAAALETWGARL
jgi:hypothetical protein